MDTRPSAPSLPEQHGIDTIPEVERVGHPHGLFWPWFAANVSILGISYGSFLLAFRVSFPQAIIVGVVGIVASFFAVGVIALAGKRGNAPTMVLSRAAFGYDGNRLSSLLSWILCVGWETVLVATAVLTVTEVFTLEGWGGGGLTKDVALVVIVGVVVLSGVYGFNLIMRMQAWITIAGGALTLVFLALVIDKVNWTAIGGVHSAGAPQFLGGLVFMMTGFGLGWVNAAADYSRYLPRASSGKGIVFWTTLGGALAPVVLVVFGLMLSASSKELNDAVGSYSVGGLATISPRWFLVPFLVLGLIGLVAGATMDIYSSGLSLLAVGVPVPRWTAALADGVLMAAGAAYVVFRRGSFFAQFQGFLITLGVPIAAWAGVMLADVMLRRKDYREQDLHDRTGIYGSINWVAVGLVLGSTAIGWGLVTNSYAGWLNWQGYLLGSIGGKGGDWASANLGVLVALVIGFLGTLANKGVVVAQEAA